MTFHFKVAPQAEQQIRAAAEWWSNNRPKAPSAFVEDLEAAFTIIQELPNAGQSVPHPTVANLRRILLGRVRYHLLYAVSAEQNSVEVLAL